MKAVICDRCGQVDTHISPDGTCETTTECEFTDNGIAIIQMDLCEDCRNAIAAFMKATEIVEAELKDERTLAEFISESNIPESLPKIRKDGKKHGTVAEKECRTCGLKFHPTSNVQKDCPACSKKVRKLHPAPG